MNSALGRMSFDLQLVLSQLDTLTGVVRFRVALSGGVDSSVLLHALAELSREGRVSVPCDAAHIHHGLSPNADRWSQHCRTQCEVLGLPYFETRVEVDPADERGLEAAARHARYEALAATMTADTCLLMAHHADDQAETLMLQLLRGSGPQGLSAMPRERPFGKGRLFRPLLDVQRVEILEWARSRGIVWVEDESNRELDRDRNFLRLEILPHLRERWPSLAQSLSRSARLCAEASALAREQAESDRMPTRTAARNRLRWTGATVLSLARRKNLLRYWIDENGLPLPNSDRLEQMAHELWEAGEDRQPMVHWPGVEVRRYREDLYIGAPLSPWSPPTAVSWDGRSILDLGVAGRLEVTQPRQKGAAALCLPEGRIEIRFRSEGETCQLAGRQGTRSLKKVFQELGVEPWLRDRIPLIYVRGRLAAIADRAVCEGFQCAPGEAGVVLAWHPGEG